MSFIGRSSNLLPVEKIAFTGAVTYTLLYCAQHIPTLTYRAETWSKACAATLTSIEMRLVTNRNEKSPKNVFNEIATGVLGSTVQTTHITNAVFRRVRKTADFDEI